MRLIDRPENAVAGKPPLYDRFALEATFLPVGAMLQLDRVLEIEGGRLVAEIDIASHWVFPMHFPSDPIFPGTLLIEAAGQAVAVWGWHAGFRGRPRLGRVAAKFEGPVLPQDQTVTLVAMVRQRKFVFAGNVDIFVLNRKVAQIDLVIMVISQLTLDLDRRAPEGLGGRV